MMTEHDHQVEIFKWRALNMTREPRLHLLHAIPNGGYRHKTAAKKMKAEGQLAGIPDIHLPVPRIDRVNTFIGSKAICGSLYIELKKPPLEGRKRAEPTTIQKYIIKELKAAGNCVRVCYGYQEAIALIKRYLEME